MPEPQVRLDPAPASSSSASLKLLRLLRRRLGQLAWALLGLAAAVGVFAAWWATSLRGLPDIGDPFDVASIREPAISDEQNAFVFLRRAHETLTPLPDLPPASRAATLSAGWSEAGHELQAWVEANRRALELFRRGADQSDGVWPPDGMPFWQRCRDSCNRYRTLGPGGLMRLALLEGERLARAGDAAGAWECYRAVLRMATHLRRRGSQTVRYFTNALHTQLRQRLAAWAVDSKTTTVQLRRALDEALESRPLPEWDAFSLKCDYLELMRCLGQWNPNYQAIEDHLTYSIGGVEVPIDLSMYIFGGERLLRREPERSRRALRMLFANWLAHVERPELSKSPPVVRALISSGKSPISLALYPMGPGSPAGARVLSPRELATWLITMIDAKPFLSGWLWPSVRDQERRGYRELVIALATELYRRERGGLPASEESLVGTYLQSLPDDGSTELDDGSAMTVSNSHQPIEAGR
jgi:hypothetical protein